MQVAHRVTDVAEPYQIGAFFVGMKPSGLGKWGETARRRPRSTDALRNR
jgi:hypothetical protein